MKYKILGLLGLVWGAGVAYSSFGKGLSTATGYETGTTIAFGFGVLLMLAGGSALWDELNGREASLGGRALWFLLIAAGLTIAMVKWGPSSHPSESECDEAVQHYRELVEERDPDGSYLEQFERKQPRMMKSCMRGTDEQRRCILGAESPDDVKVCLEP